MTFHVYGLFAYYLISYLYMYLLVHLTDMSSNPHRKGFCWFLQQES